MAKHELKLGVDIDVKQAERSLENLNKKTKEINKTTQGALSSGREARGLLDNEKSLKNLGAAGKEVGKIMRGEILSAMKTLQTAWADNAKGIKETTAQLKQYRQALEAAKREGDPEKIRQASDLLSNARSTLAAQTRNAAGIQGGLDELSPSLEGKLSKMFSRVFGGGLSGALGFGSAVGAMGARTLQLLDDQPKARARQRMEARAHTDLLFQNAAGGGLSAQTYAMLDPEAGKNAGDMMSNVAILSKLLLGQGPDTTVAGRLGAAADIVDQGLGNAGKFNLAGWAIKGAAAASKKFNAGGVEDAYDAAKGETEREGIESLLNSNPVARDVMGQYRAMAQMRVDSGRRVNAYLGNGKFGWKGRFAGGMGGMGDEGSNVALADALSGAMGSNASMAAMFSSSAKYAKHFGIGEAGNIMGGIATGLYGQNFMRGRTEERKADIVDKKMEQMFGRAFAAGLQDNKFLSKFGEIIAGESVTFGGGRTNVEGISNLISSVLGDIGKKNMTAFDIESTGRGVKTINDFMVNGDQRNRVMQQVIASQVMNDNGVGGTALDRIALSQMNMTDLLAPGSGERLRNLGFDADQADKMKSDMLKRSVYQQAKDTSHAWGPELSNFVESLGNGDKGQLKNKRGMELWSIAIQQRMGVGAEDARKIAQLQGKILTGGGTEALSTKEMSEYKKFMSKDPATIGSDAKAHLDAIAAKMASAGAEFSKAIGNQDMLMNLYHLSRALFELRLNTEGATEAQRKAKLKEFDAEHKPKMIPTIKPPTSK